MRENAVEIISKTVERWRTGAAVEEIEELTPDASLRRYFRLKVSDVEQTVVAMLFDSVASPEASGVEQLPSDRSYVELSYFLEHYGMAVPRLLYDDAAEHVLLIEDLGNRLLAGLLLHTGRSPAEDAELERLYRRAVEQIALLQSIPRKAGFFPFERSFSAELYRREMAEFEQYILGPLKPEKHISGMLSGRFDDLAVLLSTLPNVLVHRDFHSWNLMVDNAGKLRVIDFQDALMATAAYDVVGLLNDRDTDSALGEGLYCRLLDHFFRSIGSPENFFIQYDHVLLQRDLKVAGRFIKLSRERGLKNYERWVPGTLRRVGSTLVRLSASQQSWAPVCEALVKLVPEIFDGAAKPRVIRL